MVKLGRKIFCTALVLGFICSSISVSAIEYPEATIGAKFKHSPELAVSMLGITPFAFCPLINIFAAAGMTSSTSSLYSYVSDKNLAIQKEFVKNNPQKAEDYINIPIFKKFFPYELKQNFDNEDLLLNPDNFDLKFSLLKRMDEIFSKIDYKVSNYDHGLIAMLELVNSENYDFFLALLSKIESKELYAGRIRLLYFYETNCYKENLDLIKVGLEDETFTEYAKLYEPLKEKKGYDFEYNYKSFEDNFKTFCLLKENGFSDEQIASIINLKPIELIDKAHTAFNIENIDKLLKYREKYKTSQKVLKNKKLSSEQKYEKLYKELAQTKMEKIAHLPGIKQTLETGDKVISVPVTVLSIPYLTYFGIAGEMYKMTYEDWEKYVIYKEMLRKDKKAVKKLEKINKD